MSRSYLEIDKIKNATLTASQTNGAYVASNLKNNSFLQNASANWASVNMVAPIYVTADFGSAVSIDTICWISTGQFANSSIRNGSIQWSDDNSTWTTHHSFTDLGGAGVATAKRFTISFTLDTHRYWRIKIDSNWGYGLVAGCRMLAYNSADLGANALSGGSLLLAFNAVGTFSKFNDDIIQEAGVYCYTCNVALGNMCLDLGAVRYVEQALIANYTSVFLPGYITIYISDTGAYNTWTQVERRKWSDMFTFIDYNFFDFKFLKKYKTRYIRFDFDAYESTNAALAFTCFEFAMFTASTPTAPSTPVLTSVTQTDSDVGLAWSWATGTDNLISDDIVFDVERQLNGGGYSAIATGLEDTFYTDVSAPTGTVQYRVKARNKYHLEESAYVTSDALTTPVVTTSMQVHNF